MYKVKIIALDAKVITERTGKSECIALTKSLPKEGDYHLFFYHNEECESPGVAIDINNLEILNSEYLFYDYHKRPFKLQILGEEHEIKS